MTDLKIKIVKRRDGAASEAAAKSRLAAAALLISEKVGLRTLTTAVNDWILERDEKREREDAESREQIRTWKEEDE